MIPALLYENVSRYGVHVFVEGSDDRARDERLLGEAVTEQVRRRTGRDPATRSEALERINDKDVLTIVVHASVRRRDAITVVALSVRPYRTGLSGSLLFAAAPEAFIGADFAEVMNAVETCRVLERLVDRALGLA